jgi:hypothetical protein
MTDNIYGILWAGKKIMQTAASQEWQDHDTLLRNLGTMALAVVTIIALAALLPSEPVAAQAAVPCTAIDNDAERLACYDRALRPSAEPSEHSAAGPAGTEVAPRTERRVRESTARPAPAAPAAAPAARDEGGIVPLVIVGVRTLPGRETTFTTEDGARWVQTDSQQLVGLPEAPFEAELKPGAMGSRFLQPKDHPRAIRVRPANR